MSDIYNFSSKYRNRAKIVYKSLTDHSYTLKRDFDYFYCKDYEAFHTYIDRDTGISKRITTGKIETNELLDFLPDDFVEIYGDKYRITDVEVKDNDNQKGLVKMPSRITVLTLVK